MSQLPQQAIVEFQSLWNSEFGEELEYDQAEILAHDVFAILRLGLSPHRLVKPTLSAAQNTPNDAQSNESTD